MGSALYLKKLFRSTQKIRRYKAIYFKLNVITYTAQSHLGEQKHSLSRKNKSVKVVAISFL